MEKTEAEKILKEKLETAEKILVGIGSEWKKKEGTVHIYNKRDLP